MLVQIVEEKFSISPQISRTSSLAREHMRVQQPRMSAWVRFCVFTAQCTYVSVSLLHFPLIDLHLVEQEADSNLHACLWSRHQRRARDMLDHSASGGVESACWGHSTAAATRPPSGCADGGELISHYIWLHLPAPDWGWLRRGLRTLRTHCFCTSCVSHRATLVWQIKQKSSKPIIEVDVCSVCTDSGSTVHFLTWVAQLWRRVRSVTEGSVQQMAESTHVSSRSVTCSPNRHWLSCGFVLVKPV